MAEINIKCPFREDGQCDGFKCPCYYEELLKNNHGGGGIGSSYLGKIAARCRAQEDRG